MFFVHLGKIPKNGEQILTEFLIDNHVDLRKFKSFTSKRCASEDCTESKNNKRVYKNSRSLINYPISDSCWNNQVKPALFLLGDQIFYSNNENFDKPMKKSYIGLREFIYSIFLVLE